MTGRSGSSTSVTPVVPSAPTAVPGPPANGGGQPNLSTGGTTQEPRPTVGADCDRQAGADDQQAQGARTGTRSTTRPRPSSRPTALGPSASTGDATTWSELQKKTGKRQLGRLSHQGKVLRVLVDSKTRPDTPLWSVPPPLPATAPRCACTVTSHTASTAPCPSATTTSSTSSPPNRPNSNSSNSPCPPPRCPYWLRRSEAGTVVDAFWERPWVYDHDDVDEK